MECATIQLSDYLDLTGDKRGTCKECKMEIFWSATNLATHKRTNCIIPEEQKAQWTDPYDLYSKPRNISDYLENKNPVTRRGTCKVCGLYVYWTNMHLSLHKRSKCKISQEEKSEWEQKNFDDLKRRQQKKVLDISNYLENKNTATRRGNCMVCGIEVYWSFQGLVSHKRRKCIESEIANEMWSNFEKNTPTSCLEDDTNMYEETPVPMETTNEIRLSSTDIISEYLQDKDPSTRRGTCRACIGTVFWTVSHLISHKLRKCPISESEKESWISLREKLHEARVAKSQGQDPDINIGDYLTDKNILTRRGTCKICQARVYWATMHLASHKKSKCHISQEEKMFWATMKKTTNVKSYVLKDEFESIESNQIIEQVDEMDHSFEENVNAENSNGALPYVETVFESTDFKCQYCEKSFKSKQYLLIHEQLHTNPLTCDYCHKVFSSKQYLRSHILTHINKTTKESYKGLEQEASTFGSLLDMFEGDADESHNNVLFEEVLIKQEVQEGTCETEAEPMYEEPSHEEPDVSTNYFECCHKQFSTFSDLARHQYTDHTEVFHKMLESMRDEILNVFSINDSSDENEEFMKTESVEVTESDEDNVDNNPEEVLEDFITPNVNVECFICEKQLRASSYDKHLSTMHPLEDATKAKQATERFCCNCCTEKFRTMSLCISHLKKALHQYSGTECNVCQQGGFQSLRELNEHRRTSHKSNVPTCHICQKTFKHAQTLKLHRLTHEGMKPAYCAKCGYKTVTQEEMDRHMVKHENEPDSVCNHCGRTFSGILKLKRHVLGCHTSKPAIERLELLECKYCGFFCLGKERLQGHIYRSHRERHYECIGCDKRFVSKRLLDLHRVVHTQEIKFFCDICGKGFTRNNTLRKHVQTHDDSTLKLFCDICAKGFRDKRDLERHIKVHVGQKDFRCSVCAAAFFDRNGLQKHMLRFHGYGLPDYKSTKINVVYKNLGYPYLEKT